VAKLWRWNDLGARIAYLTSSRSAAEIAQDAALLKRHGFPEGALLARRQGETYGDVAGKESPDVLIEDDCESIGANEMTYSQIRPEQRARIKSIIVPEFGGIGHLPDSLEELIAPARPRAGRKVRALEGVTR
jgi:hypothetical protein